MILSGMEIEKEIKAGNIVIEPFQPEHVNPVSIDLTLGSSICVYKDLDTLDSARENEVVRGTFKESIIVVPWRLYLMHTVERIWTEKYVPVIDGKSSIGRLGVAVHVTAGFGEPGFDGQYTLEVLAKYETRLYPGMRICQIRFHEIKGDVRQYEGNYRGDNAKGPVPSMSWKQFDPEAAALSRAKDAVQKVVDLATDP
jgi:dCTP deaminase